MAKVKPVQEEGWDKLALQVLTHCLQGKGLHSVLLVEREEGSLGVVVMVENQEIFSTVNQRQVKVSCAVSSVFGSQEGTYEMEDSGMARASKSGINVRDPISGPKCPDNIFGEKGPINIRNNEPYSVYTLYYDQLLSILMDLVHFSSEFGRKLVRLCVSS